MSNPANPADVLRDDSREDMQATLVDLAVRRYEQAVAVSLRVGEIGCSLPDELARMAGNSVELAEDDAADQIESLLVARGCDDSGPFGVVVRGVLYVTFYAPEEMNGGKRLLTIGLGQIARIGAAPAGPSNS